MLNSDQNSSKYITVGRTTMKLKDSTRFSLAGSNDKHSITLKTFSLARGFDLVLSLGVTIPLITPVMGIS